MKKTLPVVILILLTIANSILRAQNDPLFEVVSIEHVRNISHSNIDPRWFQEGEQILFTSDENGPSYSLWQMKSDGSDAEPFIWKREDTKMINVYSFSSSTRVGFVRGYDNQNELWLCNTSGSSSFQMTKTKNNEYSYFSPFWFPNNDLIMYERQSQYNSGDLFYMQKDGSHLTQITKHPARDTEPCYGANSIFFSSMRSENWDIWETDSKMRFINQLTDDFSEDRDPDYWAREDLVCWTRRNQGQGELWIMRSDGTGKQKITDSEYDDIQPKWHPQQSQILFSSNRNGNYDIWSVQLEINTSDDTLMNILSIVPLTAGEPDETGPEWDSIGSSIFYTSDENGKNTEIWKMNSDGSNQNRFWWRSEYELDLQTSFDGSKIVFTRGYSKYNNSPHSYIKDIWVMDSDGTNPLRLTTSSQEGDQSTSPALTPDGSKVIFSENWGLHMMNCDGSGRQALTYDVYQNSDAAVSPDGTKIIYASVQSQNWDLWIMNMDGTQKKKLTSSWNDDRYPCWSYDGKYIAWINSKNGSNSLWIMTRDGSQMQRVTQIDGLTSFPSWHPSEDRLLFRSNKSGRLNIWAMNLERLFPSYDQLTPVSSLPVGNENLSTMGCAWSDINNDGFDDLFVANMNQESNAIYINDQNRSFTPLSNDPAVNDMASSAGGCWGDFDNDGDPDLFVANMEENNGLYINDGTGSFTPITQGEIVSENTPSTGASWADINRDGYLDIFITNTDGENNSLHVNNGNGTFTKVTEGDIVNDGGHSRTAVWADYNNDGAIDLFVANSNNEVNFLYRNNGEGTFQRVDNQSPVAAAGNHISASWTDWDNDRDMDLFVTSSEGQNRLYFNDSGDFSLFAPLQFSHDSLSTGNAWGDFDNDGDLDLAVSRDNRPGLIYRNNGKSNFTPFTTDISPARGCGTADFDNDGDLDLFKANFNQENTLLENSSPSENHWIKIRCIGTRSNYSAIGAIITIKAVINSISTWQTRQVSAQTGMSGQSSRTQHFGVGDARTIEYLKIQWPSGIVWDTTSVQSDQLCVFTEKESQFKIEEICDTPDDQGKQVDILWMAHQYDNLTSIQSVTHYCIWHQLIPLSPINDLCITAAQQVDHIQDLPRYGLPENIGAFFNVNNGFSEEPETWQLTSSAPALQSNRYRVTVDSRSDSTSSGVPWNHYYITAHTIDTGVFYATDAERGYSVDNIAPAAPTGLVLSQPSNSSLLLTWQSGEENDLSHYLIFRGESENFPLDLAAPYAISADPTYTDTNLENNRTYYYKTASVDSSENMSEISKAIQFTVTSVGQNERLPEKFMLYQNQPNPFNPSTTLVFEIPEKATVRLTVFGVNGRKIKALIESEMPAGRHSIKWNGKDSQNQSVASGLYFYCLEAGGFTKTMKMIFVR